MKDEVIKCLVERRSVRKYTDKQVPKETLDEILKCGTFAPSGMGMQSATMVVVQNEDTIKDIAQINTSIMGRDIDPFYGAKTVVIVFAKKDMPTYIYDGTCVAMNLMNAAFASGVDSCWIHRAKETFETEKGKEYLSKWGLDDTYEGIANIILGYRDGDLPPAKERKENYVIYD